MLFDAIVLAGGRSSRLDGVPKAEFTGAGLTLRERSFAAVRDARVMVVVGDLPTGRIPAAARLARESPPFGGPAAAIAAGMAALADRAIDANGFTIVLACDMPGVAAAVQALLAAFPVSPEVDGLIAVDGGRRQPLVAVYRNSALRDAIAAHNSADGLTGLPVFRLIDGLSLTPIVVPAGSTADVDTWADAAHFGLTAPKQPGSLEPRRKGESMDGHKDDDEVLRAWSTRLAEELDIGGLDVDINAILGLAGRAAHAVLRPAAPLTTFLVGYAAGRAAGSGAAEGEDPVQAATAVAQRLCREAQTDEESRTERPAQ